MNNTYKISKRRKANLERELNYMKTTRTREVEAMIAEAMKYGDLENNSEYDAAKCEQHKLLGRIAEVENILSCAVIVETEEKHLSEAFLIELKEVLWSCGLNMNQADSYAEYCRTKFEDQGQEQYGVLPANDMLETLKEAQRIICKNPKSSDLNDYTIDRYLRIPCDQWQSAKNAVMECFDCTKETVDALFDKDAQWLALTTDAVYDVADYLKATFSDNDLSWKIFCRGVLFGVEERIKSRTAAILELLGEEFGIKVIRMDAETNQWIYWGYYSDPVGCLAYMLECGLSPEKILELIEKEPNFLYMYRIDRRLSYDHNQEYIDMIIQRYK
ncbi:MAG: hypothetical protein IJB59_14440 [Oscillospiraceae bacterium]|nr:hypothetical protein [Oscillospiraceae bacterium]